jgi:hypothetical protein
LGALYDSLYVFFLIGDNPAAILTFYRAFLLPGPFLTNGLHAVFKVDDVSMDRANEEACHQACRDDSFHLALSLSSYGYPWL